jgi:hypothetical protein
LRVQQAVWRGKRKGRGRGKREKLRKERTKGEGERQDSKLLVHRLGVSGDIYFSKAFLDE